MKKLVFLFASLFITVIAVQNVNAQTSATASDVPASAKIITPIDISLTNSGLEFGTLIPSGTDGTVTVPPTGSRTNNNVGVIGQEDEFSAASFMVTGEEDYTFSITLPDDGVVKLTSGDNSMEINDFEPSLSLTGNEVNSEGTTFTVGATLSVSGTQPSGTYEGKFDVTVAYE